MRLLANSIVVFFCTFFALLANSSLALGQLKTAGQRQSQLVGIDKINHASFDQLLRKYVNEDGEVNYSSWKSNSSDRKQLQEYISHLSSANPDLPATRNAKLAYWINAYNAVTLEGILEVYPTSSIRNHTKKLGYDIWHDLKLIVGNSQINLNDIEHKVLRKMNEPRIHFAIVCASVGCPRLLNQAYTATELESQLVANTRDFFSRSRNLNFDANKKQIQLSAILKWFGSDFGSDISGQLRTISPYFPSKYKSVLQQGGFSVAYQDYDWNLNAQRIR